MELNFKGQGSLKHRVKVQAATTMPPYPGGQPIEAWADVSERWCSMEPLGGKELEIARQLHEEVTHKFVFRWFSGLYSRMRIVKGDRIFSIVDIIDPAESKLWLFVTATELK